MTHGSWPVVKRSDSAIEGSATLTTVMSRITMNWATASTASVVHGCRGPASGAVAGCPWPGACSRARDVEELWAEAGARGIADSLVYGSVNAEHSCLYTHVNQDALPGQPAVIELHSRFI